MTWHQVLAGAQPGQLCQGGRGLCAARVLGPGLQVCSGLWQNGQNRSLGDPAKQWEAGICGPCQQAAR